MLQKQDLRYGVIQESGQDLKRVELYNVTKGQEVLGKNLTVEGYCDLMEDLAQQFYDGKFQNPLDLTTTIQKEYEK